MIRFPSRLLAAVALVFGLTLLARWPAAWLRPVLPASIGCRTLSGSIWAGQCTGLKISSSPVGDADWTLRGVALLELELAGTLALRRPGASVETAFERSIAGRLRLENLQAHLPLTQPIYRGLVPRFSGGELEVGLARLVVQGKRVRELRGRIEARGLVQPGSPPTPLGSYEVRFDSPPQANGDIVGLVHDLGGPIAFDGTFTLTPAPGFRLQGQVAARAGAAPDLERAFRFLGSPDAQGRRTLSEEGTF